MSRKRDLYLDDGTASKDQLGYQPYVNAISNMILHDVLKTPFTIGIYGKWGSGKSTMMKLIKEKIDKRTGDKIYTSWFCPWQYHDLPNLLIPLLLQLQNDAKEFRPIKSKIKSAIAELEKIGSVTTEACLEIATKGILDVSRIQELGERHEKKNDITKSPRLEDIMFLQRLTNDFKQLVKSLVGDEGKLLIFIDDLDRCHPDKVVEILESIKLFIGVERCIFIIGMNYEIVTSCVRSSYAGFGISPKKAVPFEVDDYLEKIVQLPFRIPAIRTAKLENFINTIEGNDEIKNLKGVFARFLPKNPRKIKKALNIFRLMIDLAKEGGFIRTTDKRRKEKIELLAKILIIRERWHVAYGRFEEDTSLLKECENDPTKLKTIFQTKKDIADLEQILKHSTSRFGNHKNIEEFFSLSEATASISSEKSLETASADQDLSHPTDTSVSEQDSGPTKSSIAPTKKQIDSEPIEKSNPPTETIPTTAAESKADEPPISDKPL